MNPVIITDALFDQGADISPVSIPRLRRAVPGAAMGDVDAVLRHLAQTGAVRLHRSHTPSPFHDLAYSGDYYSMIRLSI